MVKLIQKEIIEDIDVSENQVTLPENVYVKILKHKKALIAFGAVTLVALGLFFAKGLFIAATVNGNPISRLSVVRELEEHSGKQALESLIQRKLIEAELNKKGITITQEEIDIELKRIEGQVVSQGETLKDVLVAQGMTEEQLREQVAVQKKLEKLLADKIQVSDEELNAYIENNKITPPEGVKIEDFRKQLSDQLKQQKFSQEAQKWISDLTTNAKIRYYVNY